MTAGAAGPEVLLEEPWDTLLGVLIQSISRQTCRGSNLIAQKTGSYATSSSVKTFEVYFSQVISIRAVVTYTATARIATSTTSYSLDDGMASASCSCVSVTFKTSSKSSNGSCQSGG